MTSRNRFFTLSLLALTACTGFADSTQDGRSPAARVAAEARQLAAAGRINEAIRSIDEARVGELPVADQVVLRIAAGWTYAQSAQRLDGERKLRALKAAAREYEAALRLDADRVEAIEGLAASWIELKELAHALESFLALTARGQNDAATAATWFAIGEIHAAWKDNDAAREAYLRAHRGGYGRAAVRALQLPLSDENLLGLVEDFIASGHLDAAIQGLETLLRRKFAAGLAGDFNDVVARWALLTGFRNEFDESSAQRLPRPSPDAPLPASLRDLDRFFGALREGKLDVVEFDAKKYLAEQMPSWGSVRASSESLAMALRSLARNVEARAAAGTSSTLMRRAANVYEMALVAAQSEATGVAALVLDAEHPDLELDVALDVAAFYDTNRLGTAGGRILALLEPHAPLDERTFKVESRTDAQMRKYYTTLGLIGAGAVADRGWMVGNEADRDHVERMSEMARRYLRQAIEVTRGPTPVLREKYGDILVAMTRERESVEAYHEAARDYFAANRDDDAYRVGETGVRLGFAAAESLDLRTMELENYLYPSGFYVGFNFGATDGRESSADIAGQLNSRRAGRNVGVALDDTDDGFKAFLGYRFGAPFAVELGYIDLEGQESSITGASAGDTTLLQDVLDVHPVAGRGVGFSLLGYPIEYRRFSLFGKIGGWYWKSDAEISVAGTNVKSDADGIDLQAGVGLEYRFSRSFRVRAEYERYFLDSDDIDFMSVGLTYRF